MPTQHRISTCLWFDDKAEEAANLYVSLIPHSRIVSVNRYGPGQRMREGLAMLVRFELDGVAYSGLNGGPMFPLSEAVSLVVECDTQDEIDRLWSALIADGGAESMCGWCKDRFGLSWQIAPSQVAGWMASPDKAAQGRMWEKLMGMRKIETAVLEAAFNNKG